MYVSYATILIAGLVCHYPKPFLPQIWDAKGLTIQMYSAIYLVSHELNQGAYCSYTNMISHMQCQLWKYCMLGFKQNKELLVICARFHIKMVTTWYKMHQKSRGKMFRDLIQKTSFSILLRFNDQKYVHCLSHERQCLIVSLIMFSAAT